MNLERINVRQPVRKLLKGITLFTLILSDSQKRHPHMKNLY